MLKELRKLRIALVLLSAVLAPAVRICAKATAEWDPNENIKVITWTVAQGNLQGHYELCAEASAKCGCGSKKSEPEPTMGNWNLDDGTPVDKTATAGPVTVPHAEANLTCTFSAEKRDATKKIVVCTNRATGKAWAEHCQPNNTSNASVKGKIKTHLIKQNGSKGVKYSLKCTLKAWGKANGGCSSEERPFKYFYKKDPVAITLLEVETGLEHEEILLDMTYKGETGLSDIDLKCDWESGILLSTQKTLEPEPIIDGFVEIIGSINSSWLVTPYGEFGARLDQGVFTATGIWATAPWSLTYDDTDVVSAFLAPEYVPQVLDYVIPDSYFTDGMTYEQSLTNHEEIALCVTCIPEPATVFLFGLGGLMLRRKKRA